MPESVLIVGLGEVGRPLYELAAEAGVYDVYGYDIDPSKTVDSLESIPRGIDYLHIAIPYSEGFVDIVLRYIRDFSPSIVVIHSTVAPGTTRKVYDASGLTTAFSPVRGRHPRMKRHLRFWRKWVSVLPASEADTVAMHMSNLGFNVRVAEAPVESLELAKLWETVYRAIMIASWQEIHRIAGRYGADLGVIAEFVAEVHSVLGDRPVYYPDYIGGHCLIPNVGILNNVYPSKLFEFVLESNDKRAAEVGDPRVKEEVLRLRELMLNLTDKSYYE